MVLSYTATTVVVPKLVGVGSLGVAISTLASHLPIASHQTKVAALHTSVASGIAVTLRTLALLGCETELIGVRGADAMGGLARDLVNAAGIATPHLIAHGVTATTISMVAADGWSRQTFGPPTHGYDPVNQRELSAAYKLISGASAVLLDGSLPALAAAVADAARANHIPVISHISDVRDGLGEIIAVSDVVIASEHVAGELSPRGELTDAIEELLAMGPRTVIITVGERGAIGQHGDRLVECAAFPSEVLDSYGAGAVFHGGFTAALLSALPFARCVEVAAAAAALSCQSLGAWDFDISRAQLDALLARRG
ncbi:MAG: carbohydrate kinase family protein [Kofleriaceae bacterium]|nr:carbohydrate kinase family protein [Kofleriaceae bacterium]